jgi:Carboxypeptidase regulatory-like domain
MIKLILLLFFSFFGSSLRVQPPASAHQISAISGVVRDTDGRAVAGATILIEGEAQKYTITTDEDGQYKQILEPGIYQITARRDYFETVKRSAVKVSLGGVSTVDLLFIFVGTHGPAFGYDVFDTSDNGGPIRLVVRFREWYRFPAGNTIEYRGFGTENTIHRGVMASFDHLTIYANTIRVNRETLQLTADSEELLVVIGGRYINAKHAEINFKAKDPIATLKIR